MMEVVCLVVFAFFVYHVRFLLFLVLKFLGPGSVDFEFFFVTGTYVVVRFSGVTNLRG